MQQIDKLDMAQHLLALNYSGASLRARLAWYASQFGLAFKANTASDGKQLRERVFLKMLNEGKSRLSPEDLDYLNTLPLLINWDKHLLTGEAGGKTHQTFARTVRFGEGDLSITFFPLAISEYASRAKMTWDARIDWMRRLLMHEIGHARDHRTDEEMAATDNY